MNTRHRLLALVLLGSALACLAFMLLVHRAPSPRLAAVDPEGSRPESPGLLRASHEEDARTNLDTGALGEVPSVPTHQPNATFGAIVFLLAPFGQPVAQETWTLRSTDGYSIQARSDPAGRVELPPGVWSVEPPAHLAVEGDGRVIVSPQRTSVLWVGQKYDVVLEIRSTLGGPLEGAVATWLMDEDLGDPATDVFESLERNSAVSDGGGRVVLGAVPYPWAGRVLVTHASHLPYQGTIQTARKGEPQLVTLQYDGDPSDALQLLEVKGGPLEGVIAFAEIINPAWGDARPIFLGRTDPSGLLLLPGWVAEADALVFLGAAYPSRYRWESSTGPGSEESIEVPIPVTGELHILNHTGDDIYRVSVVDETASTAVALMSVFTHRIGVDASMGLALPCRRDVTVEIVDRSGTRSWSGRFSAESNGWRRDVTLEVRGEPLWIQADGDRITEYRIDEEVDDWITVSPAQIADEVLAIQVPPGTRTVSLRSSGGTTGHLWRRCDGAGGIVRIAFAPLYPVQLTLRDALDGPVNDVRVQLSWSAGSASPPAESACWAWWPHYSFEVAPDAEGTVSLRAPEGSYALQIQQLPWRETTVFSSLNQNCPDLTAVDVPAGGLTRTLVVPRPRRLTVELHPLDGKLPPRWSLRDLARAREQVFFGPAADLWITDEGGVFEIRSADSEPLASFDVPAGVEPLEVDVPF